MIYQEINPKWNPKRNQWSVSLMREGKRRQFTSTVPKSVGKNIVRQKALKWLEEGDTNSDVLLNAAYERFLKDYELKNGGNTQLTRLKSVGEHHILPRYGNRRTGSISLEEWQAIITDAKPIRKRTTPLSKKYLKNIRETILLFMNWATPRKYMDENFGKELFVPRNAPVIGKEILQLNELASWFSHPTGFWFERALMFEVLTGLRPSEVIGIQRKDFDPESGILTINRAINVQGQITSGKNENARRKMQLVGEVREIFEEQVRETARLRSEWVFCSPFGDMPNQRGLYRCMRRIDERFGFDPKITPYCLRHTFFTHVEGYLPQRAIKTIFGHSDATESHALYGTHEIDGELKQISSQLKVTPLYGLKRNAN